MYSTRRTHQQLGAFSRKPAAAAAEAAEVAVVAAEVAAVAAAADAVFHGALAASARPLRFAITLTNANHFGRARQSRPGQSMCSWQCRSRARLGRLAHGGRVDLQPYREMPSRALDEGIPVVGEYALHRRTKVARVPTS
jgi:hypothetical protein